MKEKLVCNFMGMDLILRIDYPEEIKEKEDWMLQRGAEIIKKMFEKEYKLPTDEENK